MSTLKLLACIALTHALTPPKSSHVSSTPSARRDGRGTTTDDALRVRGGGGKQKPKAKKPPKEKPVAKDFNQLKEVDQSWIDRSINFLEAPVTELVIGATAVSLSLVEIQRQFIELGTREADYSVLFIAASRMLKAFLAVLRSTRMALRGYKSYAVIKRGENVYLKKIPSPMDDDGVV